MLVLRYGTASAQNQKVREKVGVVFQNRGDQLFMTKTRDDVVFGLPNLGLSDVRKFHLRTSN
jgi:energy-coupling factor transporter ATP-binding protein EcfA2